MAVNVAMTTVITANIRNALSVTSCALRSVIDAIPRLPRHFCANLRAAGNLRPQLLPLSRTRPPAERNCPTEINLPDKEVGTIYL